MNTLNLARPVAATKSTGDEIAGATKEHRVGLSHDGTRCFGVSAERQGKFAFFRQRALRGANLFL
jgi:hypothetical protein